MFRKSAFAGVPESQFKMALLAAEGKVSGGEKVAFNWYQRAAEQGFRPAMFNLATMYYQGEGTERDVKKAFGMYSQLAEEGEADAQFMVARMMYEGLGTEKDVPKALEYFNKAAAGGNQLAIQFIDMVRKKQNTQFVKIDGLE